MAYQIEEIGALERRAEVVVPVESFNTRYTGALRKLSKRVRLPGFRKGKIPLSVMKRNYGPNVMQDVIEELLREQINTLMSKEDRVIFMAQPSVTQLPSESAPMKFHLDYELRPELDPVGYMGIEVARPSAEVDEARVEARIEELREQQGVLVPIEGRDTIEEGDTVTLDFRALGDDDPALEEMKGDDVVIKVGSGQAMAGIEDALKGAKFDSTITTKIELDASFPVESLREREVELEIVIKEVKASQLPELDDEFAKDLGMGESLEELKQKVGDDLKHQLEHDARHVAEDNLVEALLESTSVELPPKFVEEQIDQALANDFARMTGQQIDPSLLRGEQFQAMRDQVKEGVERQIRSEFLLMAIANKEELKVTDEDLRAYCAHQVQHMQGVDAAMFERYIRQDQQRLQQAAASALLEKTLTHLLKEAKIIDGEWPSDDEEDAESAEKEEAPAKKKAPAKKTTAKKTTAKKKADEAES